MQRDKYQHRFCASPIQPPLGARLAIHLQRKATEEAKPQTSSRSHSSRLTCPYNLRSPLYEGDGGQRSSPGMGNELPYAFLYVTLS